ncbi:MAG: hypothetical protein KAI41_11295, partial [Hyphomicrobiaceae bacterium]|nr:hypothetical protein [Hyphomicrobiaceae bacterium]
MGSGAHDCIFSHRLNFARGSELFKRTINERFLRRALVFVALAGLAAGLLAYFTGRGGLAHWIWTAATVPVVIAL